MGVLRLAGLGRKFATILQSNCLRFLSAEMDCSEQLPPQQTYLLFRQPKRRASTVCAPSVKFAYKEPSVIPRAWTLKLKTIKTVQESQKTRSAADLAADANRLIDLKLELDSFFENSQNPYKAVLYLVANLSAGYATLVIRRFFYWLFPIADTYQHLVNAELREEAFAAGLCNNAILMDTISNAFGLREFASEFLPEIRTLIEEGYVVEAARCVTALNLQGHFGLNEIFVPCILKGQSDICEPYLRNLPELQVEAVRLLNELCCSDEVAEAYLKQNPRIVVSDTIKEKGPSKTLGKVGAGLARAFDLYANTNITSNLLHNRRCASLRYLIYKRYVDNRLQEVDYLDFISFICDRCPETVPHLINELCAVFGNFKEAAFWAAKYNVPREHIPADLQKCLDNAAEFDMIAKALNENRAAAAAPSSSIEPDTAKSQEEAAKPEISYLEMPDHVRRGVLFVQTKQGVESMLRELEQAVSVAEGEDVPVGLDSEWVSGFGLDKERVAILQLAFDDRVYLLDITALRSQLSDNGWTDFFVRIFHKPKLLKLGYSFHYDMRMLSWTFPNCSQELNHLSNTICLQKLLKLMIAANPDCIKGLADLIPKRPPAGTTMVAVNSEAATSSASKVPPALSSLNVADFEADTVALAEEADKVPGSFGLSVVCHYFLGRPLEKSNQFSNWERRPLTAAQADYAALDAYCQLDLFKRLRERAKEFNIDFTAALEKSLVRPSRLIRQRSKQELASLKSEIISLLKQLSAAGGASQSTTEEEMLEPVRPHALRLVLDRMIFDVGKRLRHFGIDCRILEVAESRSMLLEYAKAEHRFPVTKGISLATALGRMPENVVEMPHFEKVYETTLWFLERFNVLVEESDLFSRCANCNGVDFATMSSAELKPLWTLYVETVSRQQQRLAGDGTKYSQIFVSRSMPFDPASGYLDGRHLIGNIGTEGAESEKLKSTIADLRSPIIRMNDIPKEVIELADEFQLCKDCGKLFWDGQLLTQLVQGFSKVLADRKATAQTRD